MRQYPKKSISMLQQTKRSSNIVIGNNARVARKLRRIGSIKEIYRFLDAGEMKPYFV